MGKMTEMSLHDDVLGLSREQALRAHLGINFYPPHPRQVVEDTVRAFKEHWAGGLDDLDELARRCHLRRADGLYRYYETFLNGYGEDFV